MKKRINNVFSVSSVLSVVKSFLGIEDERMFTTEHTEHAEAMECENVSCSCGATVFASGVLHAQKADTTRKPTAAVLDFRALTVMKKEEITSLTNKFRASLAPDGVIRTKKMLMIK